MRDLIPWIALLLLWIALMNLANMAIPSIIEWLSKRLK